MAEVIIKQNKITDIEVHSMTNQDKQEFITIKQDGTTIYLEKSKAVELQKAINNLK